MTRDRNQVDSVETAAEHGERRLIELARENERLREELAAIEAENRRRMDEVVALERRASSLSHLYVASYRLHESLDRQHLLRVIEEIVAAIVGSEELAIFETVADGGALSLIASVGISPDELRGLAAPEGAIAQLARRGELWVADDPAAAGDARTPAACIPLRLGGKVMGAIAIFRLLPQKKGFAPEDHELFGLLGSHAAMALYTTSLHARAIH